MERLNLEKVRRRIEETYLFGPELKARLLERLDEVDGERLFWIEQLLERAEDAHQKFGAVSVVYQRVLDEVEAVALEASEREADAIFAEFERELALLEK